MADERTSFRTCPLCEATCGIAVTTDTDGHVRVRGDADDPVSRGFLCPKGVALADLHHDPDRLRTPLVRRAGALVPATWDEAFAEIERRLPPLLADRDDVAVYFGNPVVHDHAASLFVPALVRALGTDHRYSASTLDQLPKQVASALMFGTSMSIGIPDVDRTDLLLVLGANPLVSNGSLFTAPDMPRRLRELRRRGGRLVVVDPRRTRTARAADEHVAVRPGTDALLLAAMAHVLFAEDLVTLGALAPHVAGLAEVELAVAPWSPEAVAGACDVPAETIRRLARELAAAPTAAVYGRIGTCTTAFGTVTSWLVDVLNVLTGNLDRPGGVLFPKAPAGAANASGPPGRGRGVRIPGSRRTRVRGLPSALGEFPAAALAEEIEHGIKALITVAGNPVLSAPHGARLEAALQRLEFLVCVDIYRNETTRLADVVLPAPSPLERSHYDLVFSQFAAHHLAKWSPPAVPPPAGQLDEGEILLRLAAIAAGATPEAVEERMLGQAAAAAVADPSSPLHGRDAAEVLAALPPRPPADRLLDLMLRAGPYGLTLDDLAAAPHGIDLGPLQPRMPDVLRTPSGRLELAPPQILEDALRLPALLDPPAGPVLVGRRELRSNNSWMHNLPPLVRGGARSVLHVHPDDAAAHGLADGARAAVTSRVATIEVDVLVTADVRRGVVSLPHGWGQTEGSVAAAQGGVSSNLLTDDVPLDPLSGTAVLNGIPVSLRAAPA